MSTKAEREQAEADEAAAKARAARSAALSATEADNYARAHQVRPAKAAPVKTEE